MPKISVVVPVYNVEPYLQKCVDSILKQTLADFELILVDDGSTDSSGRLCDTLAASDRRARVIHQKNAGLGAARNTGIEAAVGEWLLFVDSDDYIEPQTLEVTRRIGETTNSDVVVFGFQSVGEDGMPIAEFIDDIPKRQPFSAADRKDMLLGAPVAWNRLYRRRLFIDSGVRYPGRVWYEDIRTTPKLLVLAGKVVYVEDILYNYLMREGSITKNINVERNVEILEAFEDITGYFREKNWLAAYHSELEYLTVFHVYITASVRVIRIDPAHELLNRFEQYVKINFPDYRENPYLGRLGRNKRLILWLLERKMYRAIRLIFQVKG